jgi:hypothetical protein
MVEAPYVGVARVPREFRAGIAYPGERFVELLNPSGQKALQEKSSSCELELGTSKCGRLLTDVTPQWKSPSS